MQFVNPKNDVAFKKIFGDEQHKAVLIAFLNAVLNLSAEKEIIDVEILNPYQTPHLALLKYTLLDVRATDKRGINFIVEMQNERVPGLRKRFQYYAAKSYSQQIERGEDYPKLNQVVFIGILDFTEFGNQDYASRHILLNVATGLQELRDFEFNFIELPKFKKTENEFSSSLDKWVYFIKYAADLEVIPAHADSAPLRAAYAMANKFGWTRKDLEVYDYWSIKEQDERGAVELALETGLQQGLRQGLQQGMQQGIAQGEKRKALETAAKLQEKGFALEDICELTGLLKREIQDSLEW